MMRIQKRSLFSGIDMWLLLFVMLPLVILFWVNAAAGNPVKKPIRKHGVVPSPLLRLAKNSPDYAVLVDKSLQKVMLYRGDDLSSPEKVYICSTGENDGPKARKNDRKTPEGIYFFTKSYVDKYLTPIYGVRAFPIDYPNFIDKKEGRGGYGIWFHGTNKPLKPNDSNGCVVLDNKDIDDLATRIKLNETPVIISSRIKMVQATQQKKKARELEQIIEGWRSSWKEKDIKRYMSFYSHQFIGSGKNWQQWKEHKTRLAKKYREIDVDIDNLRLLSYNGVTLAKFDQKYRTATFESVGQKKLYLKKNSDQWKIVGEFFQGDIKTIKPLKKRVLSAQKEIENFIFSWREAWEIKDLKNYISCYDKRFRSRGMNLNAWKRHRDRLNRKYRSLKVDISDLKIKPGSKSSAKVSFKQDYRADRYNDVGLKKMVLVKRGKNWKIKEEVWTPISRRPRL